MTTIPKIKNLLNPNSAIGFGVGVLWEKRKLRN